MSRLDEYWVRTGRLDPNHEDAAGLLCYISQWVDAGWRDIDVIQDGLSAFPKGRRVRLSIMDYAYVLMAEGVAAVLGPGASNEEVVATVRSAAGAGFN